MEGLREKKINAIFFRSDSGNEPVKEELTKLGRPIKTIIGEDIKFVEFNWRVDRPYVDQIKKGNGINEKTIYEVRSKVEIGNVKKEFRTLFFVFNDLMILVHIFVKKSQKTPKKEINVAIERMKKWMREQKGLYEKE